MIKTGKAQYINGGIYDIDELPEHHTYDFRVIKKQDQDPSLIDDICEGDAEFCEEWINNHK